jgi:hypothetical protein
VEETQSLIKSGFLFFMANKKVFRIFFKNSGKFFQRFPGAAIRGIFRTLPDTSTPAKTPSRSTL